MKFAKQFFRTEGTKLKAMTFREKRQYIWEYYKIHILTLIVVALIGATWAWSSSPPEYLYVAWFTTGPYDEDIRHLSQALEVIVPEGSNQPVVVSNYAHTGNPAFDNPRAQRFFAMTHGGMIDGLLAPQQGILELSMSQFARSIHPVMAYVADISPVLYSQVSANLLTITFSTDQDRPEETEVTDVMGISLQGSPLLASLGIDDTDLYIALSSTGQRPERMARALEVFFTGGTTSGGE